MKILVAIVVSHCRLGEASLPVAVSLLCALVCWVTVFVRLAWALECPHANSSQAADRLTTRRASLLMAIFRSGSAQCRLVLRTRLQRRPTSVQFNSRSIADKTRDEAQHTRTHVRSHMQHQGPSSASEHTLIFSCREKYFAALYYVGFASAH